MRHLVGLLALSMLFATAAFADPPVQGFIGTLAYENGNEPNRYACDRLDLIRTLYETGDLFHIRPKFDELARTIDVWGQPQCVLGKYAQVKVLEPPVSLGPIDNPVGNHKLVYWAIHVNDSPKGGNADYWILYLDEVDENVAPLTGSRPVPVAPSGPSHPLEPNCFRCRLG